MSYAQWYRIHRPYQAIIDNSTKRYFLLNRNYKSLGNESRKWEDYPFDGDKAEYFYDDATAPWLRPRHQDRYETRLHKFNAKYSGYKKIRFCRGYC